MRFIGNKERVLDTIFEIMNSKNIRGNSFFDVFAGTSNVGKYFKKLNYKIYSSDILFFSYVLQQAYIANNKEPKFKKLFENVRTLKTDRSSRPLSIVVKYLNNIKPVKGFIYNNYTPTGSRALSQPRMYFSDENGERIDAIRRQIGRWEKKNLINDNEYYILLACLIETVPFYSNITGVYGAFQKQWDPRAVKRLILRDIELIENDKENFVFNENSLKLSSKISADIYYLDPPYNQRQYAPNYHILETIAKYDNPSIKGVTGQRCYKNKKSNFCNSKRGLIELSEMAKKAKCKTFMLSYNSEGIMPQKEIISTLEAYGNVELVDFKYTRFKSNNNGENKAKKYIKEQLYILTKHN